MPTRFLPPGSRPKCPVCGVELQPFTEETRFSSNDGPMPKSHTEAKGRVDKEVLTHTWKLEPEKYIESVGTWDGITYHCAARGVTTEPLFDTISCVKVFASTAHRLGFKFERDNNA